MQRKRTIKDRQHFTYDKEAREILLEGNPITYAQIQEIKTLVERHKIPQDTRRYYYESILYALVNQRMQYEGSLALMQKMHKLTDYQIEDANKVYKVAKSSPYSIWWLENRVAPFYKYVEEHGGVEEVVKKYLEKPYEMRIELRQIKWVELKTLSLWYTTLGGTGNLLCLDIHNTIQSQGMGIDIPKNNYIPRERKNGVTQGRKVHSQIVGNRYLRVEKELTDIFMNSKLIERYPKEFLNKEGELNGSFVSALMWWQGTQGYRGNHASQLYLFNDVVRFKNPFSTK
jgi:hypothetical protein